MKHDGHERSEESLPGNHRAVPRATSRRMLQQFCLNAGSIEKFWSEFWTNYGPQLRAYFVYRIHRALDGAVDLAEMALATIADVWKSYLRGIVKLETDSTLVAALLAHSQRQFIDFYRRWKAGLCLESMIREFMVALVRSKPAVLQQPLTPAEVCLGRTMVKRSDRRLLDLRIRGYDWSTVAAEIGRTPKETCQRFCQLVKAIRTRLQSAPAQQGINQQ